MLELEHFANRVRQDEMNIFGLRERIDRDMDAQLDPVFDLAAIKAGESNRHQTVLLGSFDRAHDVRRVTARGERNRDVAGLPVGNELIGKNRIETVIVRVRGEGGDVIGE